MMWAILGEIEFTVIQSPSGQEHRFSATFVEHARIAGKPRLEAVGGELDEIHWTIRLHERLHDVAARLRALRHAVTEQEPLALVMGDGSYLGPWLIVEGSVTATKTTAQGRILSADVEITLREYTGEFSGPTAAQTTRLALASKPVLPDLLTQAVLAPSLAQAAASAARTAQTALGAVSDTLQRAQSLLPLAAVRQVPDLLTGIGQVARAGAIMQQAGQNITAVVALGTDLTSVAESMRTSLTPPLVSTIGQQLHDAASFANEAVTSIEQSRTALRDLATRVALRRS